MNTPYIDSVKKRKELMLKFFELTEEDQDKLVKQLKLGRSNESQLFHIDVEIFYKKYAELFAK